MSEANEVTSPVERVVMLPPYVAPEHQSLLEKAEATLKEYEECLLGKIKNELFEYGWVMQPHPEDIRKAEQLFTSDPMRLHLIKNLATIKVMVERPRFRIDAT